MFLENGRERDHLDCICIGIEIHTHTGDRTSEYRLRKLDKAGVEWPTNSFDAHFDAF